MRAEYDQEIIRCISGDNLEQAGYRKFVHVGPYDKINNGGEGQKVCRIVNAGASYITRGRVREISHQIREMLW